MWLRSARALTLHSLFRRPHPAAPLASTLPLHYPRPSLLPVRTSLRIAFLCPPFDSAQRAAKFNQPLSSFDTSKVTNMGSMFPVRSARALCAPQALSRAFPAHAAGAAIDRPTHPACCLPRSNKL